MLRLPDPKPEVLARRETIVASLHVLLPGGAVIAEPLRVKPHETEWADGLSPAPARDGAASSTEQVAAILRLCHAKGVRVVPLDGDQSRHYPGGGGARLFLRTGPLQPARLHDRRQSGDELGRGAFLKYGVNNLLGLTVVTVEGEVLRIDGTHLDAAGYDWLGPLTGSEGQLAVITEVTVRIQRAPEGARAVLAAFRSNEVAGACVDAIISSGISLLLSSSWIVRRFTTAKPSPMAVTRWMPRRC